MSAAFKKKMFDGISTGSKCATWVPQNDMKRPNEFSFFSGGHNKEFLLDGRAASFWKCSTWSQPVRENLLWKEKTKKWSNRWNSLCLERQKRWGGWKKVRAIEYIYIYAIIREDQSRWFHYLLPKISSSWILIKLCLLLLLLSWEKQKMSEATNVVTWNSRNSWKKKRLHFVFCFVFCFFFQIKNSSQWRGSVAGWWGWRWVTDLDGINFFEKWGFSILFLFFFSALTVCVCPIGSGRGLGGW